MKSLIIAKNSKCPQKRKCLLQIKQDSKEYDVEINVPTNNKISVVLEASYGNTCPTLFELCKRKLYIMINVAAKMLSDNNFSIYSDLKCNDGRKNERNLERTFQMFDINENRTDKNNENLTLIPTQQDKNRNGIFNKIHEYCVPNDIVNIYFYYLPSFIKADLCNGPVSRCENVLCKTPIFDYVIYEFCLEKISLLEDTMDVILSAAFCSKSCADTWKSEKNILSWSLKE